jgi:voltage-gated potassium channel
LLFGVPEGANAIRRIEIALAGLIAVIGLGVLGYMLLGLTFLEALYQTVFTVATVGYTEVYERTTAAEIFTIVLILLGVGVVLYNLGVIVEGFTEGHIREYVGRRRMDRTIDQMHGHVIVCGYGRVGKAAVGHLLDTGHQAVAVEHDPARLIGMPVPHVLGEASDDDVLLAAGIERARALICALDTDADTVYATLSARALRPDLVIISRARTVDSKDKIVRAGATRAVNPQLIGGRRMASFALHADVAEFLDGVMHNDEVDHEFEQVRVPLTSPFAGKKLSEIELFRDMSVPVLAVRSPNKGGFLTNPPRSTVIEAGSTLILLASSEQIAAVHAAAGTTD